MISACCYFFPPRPVLFKSKALPVHVHEAAVVPPRVEREALCGSYGDERLPVAVVERHGRDRESSLVLGCQESKNANAGVGISSKWQQVLTPFPWPKHVTTVNRKARVPCHAPLHTNVAVRR